MRIAVDAMGGDHAPHEIVKGAVESLAIGDDFELVLIGDQDRVRAELNKYGGWDSRVTVVHTTQVIEMDESPVEGVRQKRDSSIVRMAKMAAAKELDAVVSAGNTGACVAACQLKMKTLPGVARPGIAVAVPSFHGPFVLCDVGANIQAKPHHLHQYAVMGMLYAQEVLGIEDPRAALMSIGEENIKGTSLVKQVNELLHHDPSINFVGNVEGRDLFMGKCEVAVCDGFVGNIVLKLVEGLAEGLFVTIADEVRDEDASIRARFDEALNAVWSRHDYTEYGGAPLLGLDGNVIVCHGRSDHRAICNAIKASRKLVRHGVKDTLSQRLEVQHA